MTPQEANAYIKRLRTEDSVLCKSCKVGLMVAFGDKRTTPGFRCNHCGTMVNIYRSIPILEK